MKAIGHFAQDVEQGAIAAIALTHVAQSSSPLRFLPLLGDGLAWGNDAAKRREVAEIFDAATDEFILAICGARWGQDRNTGPEIVNGSVGVWPNGAPLAAVVRPSVLVGSIPAVKPALGSGARD